MHNLQHNGNSQVMSSQIYQNLYSDMDTAARGPTVWSGSEIITKRVPYITLIVAYIAEIEAALEQFKELGLNGPAVNADIFPLPTLGPHLKAISKSLHEGPGFALVRGLDIEKYSDEDVMIIFLGLGSYIGCQRGKIRDLPFKFKFTELKADEQSRLSE